MGYLILYTMAIIAIYYIAGSIIPAKKDTYLVWHFVLLIVILVLYFGVVWQYKDLFLGG